MIERSWGQSTGQSIMVVYAYKILYYNMEYTYKFEVEDVLVIAAFRGRLLFRRSGSCCKIVDTQRL